MICIKNIHLFALSGGGGEGGGDNLQMTIAFCTYSSTVSTGCGVFVLNGNIVWLFFLSSYDTLY